MAEKQQETTLRDFMNVVFKRKWLILSIVGLTSFLVVYLKVSQPQSYVSSSRTLVRRGERADVFTNRATVLTWTEEVSSQIEVILSETVFNKARRVFADSLAARGIEDELTFNAGSVRADVVGESNAFVIRYSALDPLEARLGCAAMTFAYSQYYKERKTPRAVEDYFVSQINEAAEELEIWRVKRQQYLDGADIFGVTEESRLRMVKLTNLETRLAQMRSDVSAGRLRVENLAKHTELTDKELENSLSISATRNDLQSSIIAGLKGSLQKERSKRDGLLNRFTEQHPEVLACDQQITELQAQLKKEVVNAYHAEQSQFEQVLSKVKSLEDEVEIVRKHIDELTVMEGELAKINGRIKAIQSKYDLLLRKRNEAEISIASSPEWDVTVLSAAGQAWPQRTSDYVRLALGPFLSLIVALGLAFFMESMDHSIKNAAEVEEYLGKPVLANFREVKGQKRNVA
jgi:uncharacterized protein involved in exopolysaccharide biosynthesis